MLGSQTQKQMKASVSVNLGENLPPTPGNRCAVFSCASFGCPLTSTVIAFSSIVCCKNYLGELLKVST